MMWAGYAKINHMYKYTSIILVVILEFLYISLRLQIVSADMSKITLTILDAS